jgi:hypothetical protein
MRQPQMARTMNAAADEDIYEIPPYPTEWPAEQRVAAYWHALNFTSFPGVTEGWHAVWNSLERERDRRSDAREIT